MPIVTSLTPQRNGKRVNVYLDGKFSFGIDLDNLVLMGVKLNIEFSEEEIEKIIKKAEFQKTFDKLIHFAMYRPRSEKEVLGWLKRKKIHESMHEELFKRLNHLDLVNDEKFATWWVEQRIHFKSKSKRDLVGELKLKGINSEIIEKVLAESGLDETKNAKKLLEKKMYQWQNLPDKDKHKKMAEFLMRKGFGWNIIKSVIRVDLEEPIE